MKAGSLYAGLRAGAVRVDRQNEIYRNWLYDSVRLSTQEHEYQHENGTWRVHIINHAYGRVGLQVDTSEAVLYVVDKGLTCPAEGYMLALLADLAALVVERLG